MVSSPESNARVRSAVQAETEPEGSIRAGELLSWRRSMLRLGGEAAAFDWLLDLAGGLRWSQLQNLWNHPGATVSLQRDLSGLEDLWRRHLQTSEPLQYLVGVCPWRDVELQVGPGVLIPRQETEALVDLVLAMISTMSPPSLWADLGTGSGCLAVALARALPGSRGIAVDVSGEALRQAGANLARFGLLEQVTLLASNWWDALEPWWGQLDLVVSNPPYIPSSILEGLDAVVRDHEPSLALDGGPDGLAALRQVVAGARRGLAPGGLLLVEHHHDQSPAVLTLLSAAGLLEARAHPDLEGHLRFASARCPASR